MDLVSEVRPASPASGSWKAVETARVSGWEGEGQPPRARQLGLTDGAFRISQG